MAKQILEGVSPTRMELLEIRKKLILAEKGHKLLEEKRDALVEKFFDIIDKRNNLSKEIDVELSKAFSSLIQAQMILGESKADEASRLTEYVGEIDLENDNIMGVKIPKTIPPIKMTGVINGKIAFTKFLIIVINVLRGLTG